MMGPPRYTSTEWVGLHWATLGFRPKRRSAAPVGSRCIDCYLSAVYMVEYGEKKEQSLGECERDSGLQEDTENLPPSECEGDDEPKEDPENLPPHECEGDGEPQEDTEILPPCECEGDDGPEEKTENLPSRECEGDGEPQEDTQNLPTCSVRLETDLIPPGVLPAVWDDWVVYWEAWKEILISLSWVHKYRNHCTPEFIEWHDSYLKEFPEVLPMITFELGTSESDADTSSHHEIQHTQTGSPQSSCEVDITEFHGEPYVYKKRKEKSNENCGEMQELMMNGGELDIQLDQEHTAERGTDQRIFCSDTKDAIENKKFLDDIYDKHIQMRYWIHLRNFLHDSGVECTSEIEDFFSTVADMKFSAETKPEVCNKDEIHVPQELRIMVNSKSEEQFQTHEKSELTEAASTCETNLLSEESHTCSSNGLDDFKSNKCHSTILSDEKNCSSWGTNHHLENSEDTEQDSLYVTCVTKRSNSVRENLYEKLNSRQTGDSSPELSGLEATSGIDLEENLQKFEFDSLFSSVPSGHKEKSQSKKSKKKKISPQRGLGWVLKYVQEKDDQQKQREAHEHTRTILETTDPVHKIIDTALDTAPEASDTTYEESPDTVSKEAPDTLFEVPDTTFEEVLDTVCKEALNTAPKEAPDTVAEALDIAAEEAPDTAQETPDTAQEAFDTAPKETYDTAHEAFDTLSESLDSDDAVARFLEELDQDSKIAPGTVPEAPDTALEASDTKTLESSAESSESNEEITNFLDEMDQMSKLSGRNREAKMAREEMKKLKAEMLFKSPTSVARLRDATVSLLRRAAAALGASLIPLTALHLINLSYPGTAVAAEYEGTTALELVKERERIKRHLTQLQCSWLTPLAKAAMPLSAFYLTNLIFPGASEDRHQFPRYVLGVRWLPVPDESFWIHSKNVQKCQKRLHRWLDVQNTNLSASSTVDLNGLVMNRMKVNTDPRESRRVYQQVEHKEAEDGSYYLTLHTLNLLKDSRKSESRADMVCEEDWIAAEVTFDEDGNPCHAENSPELELIKELQDLEDLEKTLWKRIVSDHKPVTYGKSKEDLPPEFPQKLCKYWAQRYRLFLKYDEGIKLDEESWYSVTPELLAAHQARRCSSGVVVDAFCGAGGNAIQLAKTCGHVIAIDKDPAKVSLAQHNAEVYGVAHRIEFKVGDFFKLAPMLKADVVYLSPPWGGMEYLDNEIYDVYHLGGTMKCWHLLRTAWGISQNVALYLPRNSDLFQVIALAGVDGAVDIECAYMGPKKKAITAYFGDLVHPHPEGSH